MGWQARAQSLAGRGLFATPNKPLVLGVNCLFSLSQPKASLLKTVKFNNSRVLGSPIVTYLRTDPEEFGQFG